MKIATSLLTNKIYAGNTKIDKKGLETWTRKEDVTEDAIKAVFEWMYNKAKDTGAYQISFEGSGKMTLVREE